MKIQSSTVGMSGEHRYASTYQAETLTANMKADAAASLTFSEDAKEGYVSQLKEQTGLSQKDEAESIKNMLERMKASNANSTVPKFEEDPKVTMLKKILEALNGYKKGRHIDFDKESFKKDMNSLRNSCNNTAPGITGSLGIAFNLSSAKEINSSTVNLWTRVTASESFFGEAESTAFKTTGKAVTEDGREISFDIELSMSRSFYSHTQSVTTEDYILTDPLVFNVSNDVASVSDQKFYFDLDSDGKEELISFANNGSGFLALDKNNDGKINDGSELFGTKSGDGFKDLAQYDEDGNGWIDENDSVFKALKIYTKDEKGNDKLLSIAEFGVGAIYLGSASTEFSLKDDVTNATNGVIRKTGFYLKENGGTGLVQHVDIAI